MEIPSFYLSIIAEGAALILLILVGFVILLKRDKTNLTAYVFHLKNKIKQLTKKLKAFDTDTNPAFLLISDTLDYIKVTYEEKYGHELGQSGDSIKEDNSKEHFLYVFGYQGLKATLTSLENSNTPESTWEKIAAQMSALIENFRIVPETQFQTIIEQQVEQQLIEKEDETQNSKLDKPDTKPTIDSSEKQSLGSVTLSKDSASNQFEEIWNLQKNISNKVSSSSDPEFKGMSEGMESVTRQLKDAEMCMTMMEADIATSDEEIIQLKEQLEQANSRASAVPESNLDLTESIKKKDAIIARFTQESKEMLSLMDGMEANADDQTKRIHELEEQLK